MPSKPILQIRRKIRARSFESDTISLSPFLRPNNQPARTEYRLFNNQESDTDSLSTFSSNQPQRISHKQTIREERKWGKRAERIRVKRLARFHCHQQARRNPFLTQDVLTSGRSRVKLRRKTSIEKYWRRCFKRGMECGYKRDTLCSVFRSVGLGVVLICYVLLGATLLQSLSAKKLLQRTKTNITKSFISEHNLTSMLPSYKAICPDSLRNSTQIKSTYWKSLHSVTLLIATVKVPASLPANISGRLLVVLYFIPGLLLLLCYLNCFVRLLQHLLDQLMGLFVQTFNSETHRIVTVLKLLVSILPTLILVSASAVTLYLKDSLLSLTSAVFHQVFTITTVGSTDVNQLDDTSFSVTHVMYILLGLGVVSNMLHMGIRTLKCLCMCTNSSTDGTRYSTEVHQGSVNRNLNDVDL